MLTLTKQKEHKPATAVLGGCLSEDAKHAYVACMSGDVQRIDLATGEASNLLQHSSYASGVRLALGKRILVSAGYDGVLKWYDLEASQTIRSVDAHRFWSWDMAISSDERWIGSVTGQYLAGDYKYEPAKETEPSVKIFDLDSGDLKYEFEHTPSVQAVAFSPDNKYVAAGNLMGEIRVWDLESGKERCRWTSPDFTSWGIIKSHCYIGGVYAMGFSPDSEDVYAAGMGPMRDPMAGNGKQRWQRFRHADGEKLGQSDDKQCGEGLIEAFGFHPNGEHFVMAGRLRGGQWNAAVFSCADGRRVSHLNTKFRVTDVSFSADGDVMLLTGASGQPKPNKDKPSTFGRLQCYAWASS